MRTCPSLRPSVIPGLAVLAFLAACTFSTDAGPHPTDPSLLTSTFSGTADLGLTGSATGVSLTGDAEWSLSKTGSLSGTTATWNITATKTATVSGQLLVHGHMTVTNTGSGPATIGNIIVNLQTRQGNSWITKSSNIADATQGDAATNANVHKAASSENKATFSENAASGTLNFTDATNYTPFSLVPQQLIGAGETQTLLFTAQFDNTNSLLNLQPGTNIRAEVIVSFGNATQRGNSAADVDINGNGTLDADEARVRSVPSRLGVTVPPQTDGNATPTLSDTSDDIATTGDVMFSNAVFNLGATSGTVTATVNGGTNGGTITNCAQLTSPDQTASMGGMTFTTIHGVGLQSCSTLDVGGTPPTCTPGSTGCGWEAGDMHTASQTMWGTSSTSLSAFLALHFNTLYPGDLVVGAGRTLRFSDASAVLLYLPATGNPGALTSSSILNPITTPSGSLGGEVVALKLNIDYSSLFGNSVALGDLYICNFTDLPSLNGQTVSQFFVTASQVLGGASTTYSPSVTAAVARLINTAFVSGTPSTFAQTNLFAGGCPTN